LEPSVLDVFILFLLDRGHETNYDLQRQAGLSLGSTVPALRRLEAKRLITRQETLTPGARPKHSFALTQAGKKLVRSGWKPLFDAGRADDLDAILRVAEMARVNDVGPGKIKKFLEQCSRIRLESARAQADRLAGEVAQEYVTSKSQWNRARLEAEAKFLASLAEKYSKPAKQRR
jgi:DNA-binding PadR family transcriptional regulator